MRLAESRTEESRGDVQTDSCSGRRFVLPKRNPCRSGQLSCLSKMKVSVISGYYFNFHRLI